MCCYIDRRSHKKHRILIADYFLKWIHGHLWVFSELLKMQPYAPHIYLGADDMQEEGKFVWVATGRPVTYTNWGPSQ